MTCASVQLNQQYLFYFYYYLLSGKYDRAATQENLFSGSIQVRFKPVCSSTKTIKNIEILNEASCRLL